MKKAMWHAAGAAIFINFFIANNTTEAMPIPADVKQELIDIQAAITTNIGSRMFLLNNHELCEEGLYGAYIPSEDSIFICIDNHDGDWEELLGTAKHEGWHAVQIKCNSYRAALRDEQIRHHLKPRDRRTLHSYHPQQHRSEAEARVVEQIPTVNWIQGVKAYCEQ